MKGLSRFMAIGAVAGLAGCGIGVESFMDKDVSGSTFNDYLAREYQRLTQLEVKRDVNWAHAQRLAVKGAAAARGEQVDPWNPEDWNTDPKEMADLQNARQRLVAALAANKDKNPEACAKAQGHYDGWVEQANDNDWGPGFVGTVQPNHLAEERAGYKEYIVLCEGKAPAGKNFTIYFGFDKFNLTTAAKAVIDEISAFVKGSGNGVSVRGHTDTSGSDAYNQGLSKKRADAVAGALSSLGVTVGEASFAGEKELAVPTADGVREPLNRRVEVGIK